MVSIFFIGRVSLFVIYFDRFKDSDVNYWLTFLYGLRDGYDCMLYAAGCSNPYPDAIPYHVQKNYEYFFKVLFFNSSISYYLHAASE